MTSNNPLAVFSGEHLTRELQYRTTAIGTTLIVSRLFALFGVGEGRSKQKKGRDGGLSCNRHVDFIENQPTLTINKMNKCQVCDNSSCREPEEHVNTEAYGI